MNRSLAVRAAYVAQTILRFFSRRQFEFMVEASRGEEGEFFLQKFIDLAEQIKAMPVTYEQDGLGDEAIIHLHYFFGGDSHWYITEKDFEGGIKQAYGYAVLNGDDEMAESGYISIEEITSYGAELDLHFTPCRLIEIKDKRAERNTPEPAAYNPNPWVVVTNAGTDDEDIRADYPTHRAAMAALADAGEGADVMKRLDDGTLTTEF